MSFGNVLLERLRVHVARSSSRSRSTCRRPPPPAPTSSLAAARGQQRRRDREPAEDRAGAAEELAPRHAEARHARPARADPVVAVAHGSLLVLAVVRAPRSPGLGVRRPRGRAGAAAAPRLGLPACPDAVAGRSSGRSSSGPTWATSADAVGAPRGRTGRAGPGRRGRPPWPAPTATPVGGSSTRRRMRSGRIISVADLAGARAPSTAGAPTHAVAGERDDRAIAVAALDRAPAAGWPCR